MFEPYHTGTLLNSNVAGHHVKLMLFVLSLMLGFSLMESELDVVYEPVTLRVSDLNGRHKCMR